MSCVKCPVKITQYPYLDVLLYKVKLIKVSSETNQEKKFYSNIFWNVLFLLSKMLVVDLSTLLKCSKIVMLLKWILKYEYNTAHGLQELLHLPLIKNMFFCNLCCTCHALRDWLFDWLNINRYSFNIVTYLNLWKVRQHVYCNLQSVIFT